MLVSPVSGVLACLAEQEIRALAIAYFPGCLLRPAASR
jgi:hypothetical protein